MREGAFDEVGEHGFDDGVAAVSDIDLIDWFIVVGEEGGHVP